MKIYFSILSLLLFTTIIAAQSYADEPDNAILITTDIDNFWEAFDACDGNFSAEIFDKYYISPKSEGMAGFISGRIKSGNYLAQTVQRHKDYYSSIRESTYQVMDMKDEILESFRKFEEIYEPAHFPPVYFMVGALNSGGTSQDSGLLIGVDMYGKTDSMPTHELGAWLKTVLKPITDVPYIVAHELIHYQQSIKTKTLLDKCLMEGSADFIGELISGKHINEHVHDFANPKEEELWKEFSQRMNKRKHQGWLYGSTPGRPNDLGYWIGYKISAAYYAQAEDKQEAIYDILHIKDSKKFLDQSGYAKRFK